jgi:hypothetical protein
VERKAVRLYVVQVMPLTLEFSGTALMSYRYLAGAKMKIGVFVILGRCLC